VEVYLPEEVQGEGEVGSSVASTAAGSAASTAPDIASLVEKALAKLPPEMAAEAKDPKRKAKSRDPGWQFGWWPDIAKKDSRDPGGSLAAAASKTRKGSAATR